MCVVEMRAILRFVQQSALDSGPGEALWGQRLLSAPSLHCYWDHAGVNWARHPCGAWCPLKVNTNNYGLRL